MPRETNIQIRRGSASDWASVNPTLAGGEMAIENDTRKVKVGDGTTVWNELRYLGLDGGDLDGPAPISDPYFSNVSLLMNFDTDFSDSSGNGLDGTSPFGTLLIDNENYKFGGGSLNRNNGELVSPGGAQLTLGTEPFTIEFWLYYTGHKAGSGVVFMNRGSQNNTIDVFQLADYGYERRLQFFAGNALEYGANQPMPLNEWSHIAAVGYGAGGAALYVNGLRVAQSSATYNFNTPLYVLLSLNAPSGWRLDELRVTKGFSRYSGESFTVPDAAFPNA